ncbi:MAG: DUF1566 domain-containing protein [Sulfuritalea sp.]|nr:DUF1566 domain-containing protein [Sulfuritalea sp.]
MSRMIRLGMWLVILVISGGVQAQFYRLGANSQYVIQGESVYDKRADLTWARCTVGQRWKERVGCEGIVRVFTFDQAQQQGANGWRVPSKKELVTLIDRKKANSHRKPTIDNVAFPDMDESILRYWTSTPDGASGGWDVSFLDGTINYLSNRSDTYPVRLVRNGQI